MQLIDGVRSPKRVIVQHPECIPEKFLVWLYLCHVVRCAIREVAMTPRALTDLIPLWHKHECLARVYGHFSVTITLIVEYFLSVELDSTRANDTIGFIIQHDYLLDLVKAPICVVLLGKAYRVQA